MRFEEYNDINEVEFLKKASLTIDRSQAVSLEKDEYFVADLIGLKCISDTGETLGEIKDVLETGANDVYVIDREGGELLVPAIRDCILDVDMDAGIMQIHLLEGLI